VILKVAVELKIVLKMNTVKTSSERSEIYKDEFKNSECYQIKRKIKRYLSTKIKEKNLD
jgi:hypothetical protein